MESRRGHPQSRSFWRQWEGVALEQVASSVPSPPLTSVGTQTNEWASLGLSFPSAEQGGKADLCYVSLGTSCR